MRRFFKFVGILLLLVVFAAGALLGYAWWRSNEAMARRIQVPDAALDVNGGAEQIERGRHLVETRGCMGCHGPDLSGRVVIDAAPIGRYIAPNITRGAGGKGALYDAVKLEHAVRHGVAHDGRPIVLMPAYDYAGLSDEDVAALAAYVAQAPPVDKTQDGVVVGPLARVLWLFGKFPLLPVDMVPKDTGPIAAPTAAVTAEYGRYVAQSCIGCHGAGYSGGHIPGTPPDFKDPQNLTPHETGLKTWGEADFMRAMREGKRPDGSDIDPFMPWKEFARMDDTELRALWAFLQTVPPKPLGQR
jgi:mono/diheme cytochrome c family protein